ncbi:MAG TPA: tetratricopeptide repeat protein, partial [Planctomycetaceae bacterium]|nr:tetratricopeptide repeat protein [Planctomycetaceae bacterium]
WFQQVAHVAEQTIDLDPNRRLAGATPSFDDGILVCPTSAGACVAVDLATRSLLWGYQYPAFRAPWNRYRPTPFPPMGERWADGTVTLAQGTVLLTPVESNQLHCLDLLTGKPRWEPIDRDGMLFIGGVHQGVVFLVGTDRCRGISLETGEPAWEADLELGAARPSGRGFLTGRYYYLPTTSSELLQIDVLEGKVVQSVKTDLVLGNLISYRDQIISLNVDWLACYYQADPLRRLVESRLKQNPDDVWALLRHAELLIHDQRRDEALETLQRAYRLRPDDEVVRQLLVASLMQALEEDFGRYRKVARELEDLIDQPRQRLAYLRLLVDGSLEEGDWATAWKSLESLLASVESHRGSALLGELTVLLRVDPRYKVRFDRWLAGRISEVYSQGDAATRRAIDEKVASTLKNARDLPSLRRLLQVYGAVPGIDEARLEMARKLAQREDGRTEAELIISDLVDVHASASPLLRAEALALQAELMEKSGRPREALAAVRRLQTEFGDVRLPRGAGAAEWARDTAARLLKHPGVEANWPEGKVVVDRSQGPTVSTSYIYAFRTKAIAGATEPGTHVRYDLRMRQIQVFDPFGRIE